MQATFATQFTDLLEIAGAPAPAECKRVSFLFAPHKQPFVAQHDAEESTGEETALKFTVKCLKPKITVALEMSLASSAMFLLVRKAVVQKLLEEGYVVAENDLKLMIKTKSISDSTSVSELLELTGNSTDIALNAMIKSFAKAEEKPAQDDVQDVTMPDAASEAPSLSADAWNQIHQILLRDLSASAAAETLEKFKAII